MGRVTEEENWECETTVLRNRNAELEAALRLISNLASEARRSVEGGFHRTAVVMAQSIKDVAQTALERKE